MKALEKGPALVLTGMYFAVVAVGIGSQAPPLAGTSLLLVALTLVVFGHLLNVYQVAVLIDAYPRWPFLLDFLILGVLVVMFSLLVHPVESAYGNAVLLVTGTEFNRFLQQTVAPDSTVAALSSDGVREMVRSSVNRFFVLAIILLGLLIAWHAAMRAKQIPLTLKKEWMYRVGWVLFLTTSIVGYLLTARGPLPRLDWEVMVTRLTGLAAGVTILSALFLVASHFGGATYVHVEPNAKRQTPAVSVSVSRFAGVQFPDVSVPLYLLIVTTLVNWGLSQVLGDEALIAVATILIGLIGMWAIALLLRVRIFIRALRPAPRVHNDESTLEHTRGA